MVNNKASIDSKKCIGCATCIAVCPVAAIEVHYESGADSIQQKMIEYAYAALKGEYTTLSVWDKNADGDLVGSVELPMAVGLIGGAVRTHPTAKIAVKILGVKNANEFAEVLAAVGLAQNLGALRALASEGIQRGHMSLHARNIAMAAGASDQLIDMVAERMVKEHKIRMDRAKELIAELNK